MGRWCAEGGLWSPRDPDLNSSYVLLQQALLVCACPPPHPPAPDCSSEAPDCFLPAECTIGLSTLCPGERMFVPASSPSVAFFWRHSACPVMTQAYADFLLPDPTLPAPDFLGSTSKLPPCAQSLSQALLWREPRLRKFPCASSLLEPQLSRLWYGCGCG